MKKIKVGRAIAAGLVTALAFFFVEIVVEGVAKLLFGICESEMLKEVLGKYPSGLRFHVLNLLIFFSTCILIMLIYAAIRPRFNSHVPAAVITSLIFWLIVALFIANNINLGVFPIKMSLTSLTFNLIELPVAVLIGSLIYKEP
jgi:hypothetical protein